MQRPIGPCPRPFCTQRDFQARWKGFVAPVELDDPLATLLLKAIKITCPSPHGSNTSSPAGLGEVNQLLVPVDIHRLG